MYSVKMLFTNHGRKWIVVEDSDVFEEFTKRTNAVKVKNLLNRLHRLQQGTEEGKAVDEAAAAAVDLALRWTAVEIDRICWDDECIGGQ